MVVIAFKTAGSRAARQPHVIYHYSVSRGMTAGRERVLGIESNAFSNAKMFWHRCARPLHCRQGFAEFKLNSQLPSNEPKGAHE